MIMMNNLFSMFDPSTSYTSLSWYMLVTPIMYSKVGMMPQMNKMTTSVGHLMKLVSKEIKNLNKEAEKKMTTPLLMVIFFMVGGLNLMAIMPFNFTPTAHISISFFMSLTLWFTVMVNSLTNSTKPTMIHLTPMGTPMPLMNFMVMIEVISLMIRPITLAVRLSANMVAGHLLMSLLSNFSMKSMSTTMMSYTPFIALVLLEAAVAMIQAYVITILVTLYYKETF